MRPKKPLTGEQPLRLRLPYTRRKVSGLIFGWIRKFQKEPNQRNRRFGCSVGIRTGTRKYHNRTIRGSFREAQTYLNTRLQERDIGRLPRAAAISLNQYLDQWLTTAAKPRLRPKGYRDYETLLRLHIRPAFCARSLPFYITKLARLDGNFARSRDPPLGNTVMWRGLFRLTDIELGFNAAQFVGN